MDGLIRLGFNPDECLRTYQVRGVEWMKECATKGHGGILCDEMGLGKTCQAISFILTLLESCNKSALVLCPLSVLDNWKQEALRFAPQLTSHVYIGDPDARSSIRKKIRREKTNIIFCSYEMCLRDAYFFRSQKLGALVVDEGHRLKNSGSLLYKALEEFDCDVRFLLTGTPVQNNLNELYSLLAFVSPATFHLNSKGSFLQTYSSVRSDDEVSARLQSLIHPYLLRRTKAQVAMDIPAKEDITLYHPVTELQKKYYKAILMKDTCVFESGASRTTLRNILMQLRKCVNHPYLFDGVEPEPFELGEHLINASSKLITLDRMLKQFKENGHRVLIFSTMTRMLDILQDYLHYRDYNYERLDGSVRGEERFTAVKNFNESDTFVFLLSTRAGGQGLNLTAADTVILYDSDFNPQVDLQAAARAHRIGQTRPVKIIHLVGKSTVDEVILQRAQVKLKLTQSVIDDEESGNAAASFGQSTKDLQDILKYGLENILSDRSSDVELDIEALTGQSLDGKWVIRTKEASAEEQPSTSKEDDSTEENERTPGIYEFEGKDYSKDAMVVSKGDDDAFEQLMEEAKLIIEEGTRGRRGDGTTMLTLPGRPARARKPLTVEQLEERRLKREEALERKQAQAEEKERKKHEKKMQIWKDAGYSSRSVCYSSDSEFEEDENTDHLTYISGDVTKPAQSGTVVVLQCVDNSGQWGGGGVFSALSRVTKTPEETYEFAGDVDDLHEGDLHLIDCKDASGYTAYKAALIIAQTRSSRGTLSKVKQGSLKTGLKKLSHALRDIPDCTVHIPRIGYNTPGFDWYSTERQIRKYLADRCIFTSIYYYPRRRQHPPESRSPSPVSKRHRRGDEQSDGDLPEVGANNSSGLLNLFSGICFFIDDSISSTEKAQLRRYIVAYDGDIDTCANASTKYILATEPTDYDTDSREVKPDFVLDCVRHGQLLADSPYWLS